ncbi:hypothetical protein ACM9HF_14475 [Colwellia sp. RE-S-Sl-9]
MEALIKFSKNIRCIFESKKDQIDLPFFYSFPKNSCQSATCFHAILVREKFQHMQVVHGYNREGDENHYWLEVEGLVFDITCDQFETISIPIYGVKAHPMAAYFNHVNRFSVVNFVVNYLENVADIELFYKSKINILSWLETNG